MRTRILNPRRSDFHRYGGAGIEVCSEWRDSFDQFLADLGPRPSLRHCLVRINKRGNYEKSNCAWQTLRQDGERRRSEVRKTSDRCRSPYLTTKRLLLLGWTPPAEK